MSLTPVQVYILSAQKRVIRTLPASKKKSESGLIHISEDVIIELTRKTIQGLPNIKMAMRLSSKFGIGRKSSAIKVSVEHSEGTIAVDADVLIKYGQRIPDLAWDVQEKVKDNLERYTGYDVKAVNINVQGIYTSKGDEIAIDIPDEDFNPDVNADSNSEQEQKGKES